MFTRPAVTIPCAQEIKSGGTEVIGMQLTFKDYSCRNFLTLKQNKRNESRPRTSRNFISRSLDKLVG